MSQALSMDASVYNTAEGIVSKLDSLADFIELVNARREAKRRDEPLQGFFVLGRFLLYGGCIIQRFDPPYFDREERASLPKVMTKTEFEALTADVFRRRPGFATGGNIDTLIPAAHLIDPISGTGWTIDDCDDVFFDETPELLPLETYIGQHGPIVAEALEAEWAKCTDAWRRYVGTFFLFNDGKIDLTPDAFGEPKNPFGRDIRPLNTIVIQRGDHLLIEITRCYHARSLPALKKQKAERKEIS